MFLLNQIWQIGQILISKTHRGAWVVFGLVLVLGGCGAGALRSPLSENSPVAPAATESPRLDLKVAWVQDPPPPAKEKGGGSRDPGFCPIAPYPQKTLPLVWSDRPSLIWATKMPGAVGQIRMRLQAGKAEVWSQPVTSTASLVQIEYAGKALEPGQTYEWVSADPAGRENAVVSFRVMTAAERQRVSDDLADLEAGLKAKGATAEEIAQAKAKYFAEQQLWSDMVQVTFSVQNPSAKLKTFRNRIVEQVCRKSG